MATTDETTHWEGCVREHPACLAALVARLRGLREKATPGTWSTALDARCVVSDALVEWDNEVTVDTRPNDSALIVAAVNALPTLLDALDAQRAERDAQRAERDAQKADWHDVAEDLRRTATRLAEVIRERDRLLHEAGNCPDGCGLDHEPRVVRGIVCPAGCSARMIPDYVDTHLAMCPAVQAQLRADLARVTAERDEARQARDEIYAMHMRACWNVADVAAQRDAAVAVVEAAREEASDHCRGDGGPCDCSLCSALTAYDAALAAATAGAQTDRT